VVGGLELHLIGDAAAVGRCRGEGVLIRPHIKGDRCSPFKLGLALEDYPTILLNVHSFDCVDFSLQTGDFGCCAAISINHEHGRPEKEEAYCCHGGIIIGLRVLNSRKLRDPR
jgi:hypothetical protein